ncbi:MAG: SMI1/KNR4 family protein [Thermonemataceae bacterium]
MEGIIEENLKHWEAIGLNKIPVEVAEEMADPKQNKNEEWRIWKAIPSTVTEAEIKAFEKLIGYELPDSYKRFLQYKHFYELQIGECSFCEHPINTWKDALSDMIFNGYPREYLIDKGKVPFANWSDWGLLCFDTSHKVGNEYQIVLWDHEIADEWEFMAENFEKLLTELNKNE